MAVLKALKNGEWIPVNSEILPKYSTTETVIGTWVDGKPIYRNRFTGTTDSTGKSVALLSDVENVISVSGIFYHSLIGHYVNENNYSGVYVSTSNVLSIFYPDIAAYHSLPYDIIIEYTKTTD